MFYDFIYTKPQKMAFCKYEKGTTITTDLVMLNLTQVKAFGHNQMFQKIFLNTKYTNANNCAISKLGTKVYDANFLTCGV